ncbi:hypothetical protein M409DRAFT_67605 [Zasmidium cellare ATCC 36951]|uniref:Major facilitator superfamily (MFS) profile domain-containing protein n=1 Tax=Zasmidium cellare ATCC 36951 TaxID=1080233 RepID=A0A6A6CF71_ZASCE|nr:uncharacterized protein M409DRAFT_67605 [Zasmidium cellare ATCC 36951]KAF2164900.1 hypothetical protein M409DRAFT_67605 [Zasmidium cellare ATCC 36951]
MASSSNESPFLPPRRPKSASEMENKRLSRSSTPPYLPPRRPVSMASSTHGPSIPVSQISQMPDLPHGLPRPSIASTTATTTAIPTPTLTRHSSLRYERNFCRSQPGSAANSIFESPAENQPRRPQSHPPLRSGSVPDIAASEQTPIPAIPPHMLPNDPWKLPALEQPSISRSSSQHSRSMRPKPRASLSRLASLDSLITLHHERRDWKRKSLQHQSPASDHGDSPLEREPTIHSEVETLSDRDTMEMKRMGEPPNSGATTPHTASAAQSLNEDGTRKHKSRFRHIAMEIGFCFTIAMTQLLAEYMISGFAIELPKIMKRHAARNNPGDMGEFWPASLLSLILSATLLIFARISDMYGGYFPFMFGVLWLGIWSLLAGFAGAGILLDVSRAMQGLAIAASIPSTFAMLGSTYPEGGKRKNIVLGLYAGCAPVGFFAGFLVAGALPDSAPGWYFYIAAALSFITAITAYLTVPHDPTDREKMNLKMDWWGAFLITAGLILVAYALAVEPYAAAGTSGSGWSTAMVLGPLICGLGCLGVAFWVEGWYMTNSSALLPFDFFKPKSVKALSMACLCFYASYGVWLYESAQFFQSPELTGTPNGIQGVTLAAWYTPTAIGGLLLCALSGAILHRAPVMLLFFISALAWIGAPLLLALCPLPVNYWAFVMPSMLCATIGIDLTYTVSVVFLTAVSPQRYQGLAGAVGSILINLAMSFSLSISEIVAKKAESDVVVPAPSSPDYEEASFRHISWPFQAAFIYAAVSAGAGLIISIFFVRISLPNPERPRSSPSEADTLVGNEDREH